MMLSFHFHILHSPLVCYILYSVALQCAQPMRRHFVNISEGTGILSSTIHFCGLWCCIWMLRKSCLHSMHYQKYLMKGSQLTATELLCRAGSVSDLTVDTLLHIHRSNKLHITFQDFGYGQHQYSSAAEVTACACTSTPAAS